MGLRPYPKVYTYLSVGLSGACKDWPLEQGRCGRRKTLPIKAVFLRATFLAFFSERQRDDPLGLTWPNDYHDHRGHCHIFVQLRLTLQ